MIIRSNAFNTVQAQHSYWNNRGCKSIVRRCISSQTAYLTEFDEVLVKRWGQKITVRPDRYTIELRSGLSMDIEG